MKSYYQFWMFNWDLLYKKNYICFILWIVPGFSGKKKQCEKTHTQLRELMGCWYTIFIQVDLISYNHEVTSDCLSVCPVTCLLICPSIFLLHDCSYRVLHYFFQFCKLLHENLSYLRPVEQSLKEFLVTFKDDVLTTLVSVPADLAGS